VLKHSRGKTQLTVWEGAVRNEVAWHLLLNLSSDTYMEAFQYKLLLEIICHVIFMCIYFVRSNVPWYCELFALSYKPEGRAFETWWGDFFFNLP
jgi:hypothetical protein